MLWRNLNLHVVEYFHQTARRIIIETSIFIKLHKDIEKIKFRCCLLFYFINNELFVELFESCQSVNQLFFI